MPDLLIELFSEEIPARMQARAREDLKRLVTDGLVQAGLTYASAGAFSTPRRLTLTIEGLTAESRPVREERKGPRADAPAAALEGFLRSTGLTKDQLELRDDKKAQVWFAVIEKPGRSAQAIVAEVLEAAIRDFPWPKSMRWGSGSLRWVRPLHTILCQMTTEAGAEVVALDVDGIKAGNTTEGHRFMGAGRFAVHSFDDYRAKLLRAKVMLDSAEREAHILADAQNAAFAAGLEMVPDAGLLTEVAGLVEWPVVLMGRIPDAFLDLPPEVLQTSMKEHQKFFSLKNPATGRIEGFVTVANRETPDDGATILKGNLKVLSARLSDAKFFWENDIRTVDSESLGAMTAMLALVTYQNSLGSIWDRIPRLSSLSEQIVSDLGGKKEDAKEACYIMKSDLRTQTVREFPELQGVIGRYLALHEGHPAHIAEICASHYAPLGPSDAVPNEVTAIAVSLAEKLDTLTGFWVLNEKPTGSKDPYALRRSAIGAIRIIVANQVRLSLIQYIRQALTMNESARQRWAMDANPNLSATFPEPEAKDLLAFFHDRLKVHLRDEGIRHDVIDACLAPLPSAATSAAGPGNDDLTLLVKRAEALAAFLKTEDGGNLIQGFKRANNILTQAEEKDGVEYSYGADVKFAETDEERALFAALDAAEARIKPAMAAEDFGQAMAAMASLRAPIDAFFEAVQVNSDNAVVRRNRLNLLSRIRQICLSVADLTRIEG
jgi:glycyl-tRNA synthetase beta chain